MNSYHGYEGINTVEVSDFSKAKVFDDDTVFAWWSPCTLSKQDVIIFSIKLKVRK